MKTLLFLALLVLCFSFFLAKKVSHASETKKISHLANKGKPHVKGGVKPSESTNNQTNTSNTSNQTNSTSNDASTQTDSTSSSTQQNFTAACNNSQSILNRQLNAYVVVENITTNISRVFGSVELAGQWCIVTRTSQESGENYTYFEWNDQNNQVELTHTEYEENEWDVDVAVYAEENTTNFKWNVTGQSDGYVFIRIFENPDYALSMNDFGELYITVLDQGDKNQQWLLE